MQSLLPAATVTSNVEVEEWNGSGLNVYTNNGSQWFLNGNVNGDAPLLPGQRALIINATGSSITLTNMGVARDGVEISGTNYVTNYITGPTNYLASMLPLSGGLSSALSFPVSDGDRVILWSNGTNQTFTYTNSPGTNWAWHPSEPVLGERGEGFILITTNVNTNWVQSQLPCYGQ